MRMQLYRATIHPLASFSSQLQSDTLFGAFCWSYKYGYGKEGLEKLLQDTRTGKPPVIFSNAFPSGMLPMPLGIYDNATDFERIERKSERKRAYQQRKKLKSAKYVTREWFDRICSGNHSGFTAGLGSDHIYEQTIVRNMVSRDSGTVENIDGSGNLYEEDEYFPEQGASYDVYLLSTIDPDVLKKTISLMCLLGIGRNKSTGKGAFELTAWHLESFEIPNANAYVALSNFVPAQNDPVDGRYRFLVKYGRLDREYASEEIPFKKPVFFLQAGAIFKDSAVQPYYGRCLEHISVRDNVITNAYTIAVPLCLDP